MLRRPPSSPVTDSRFPYTTPFRACRHRLLRRALGAAGRDLLLPRLRTLGIFLRGLPEEPGYTGDQDHDADEHGPGRNRDHASRPIFRLALRLADRKSVV